MRSRNQLRDHADRKGAFHLELDAVQIGRKLARIGDGDGAVGVDSQDEAGSDRVLALAELLVHLTQDAGWVVAVLDGSANGAYDQRDQHSRLHAFARHVADQDQHGSRRVQRQDLKEVAAYLARRPVLAVDG